MTIRHYYMFFLISYISYVTAVWATGDTKKLPLTPAQSYDIVYISEETSYWEYNKKLNIVVHRPRIAYSYTYKRSDIFVTTRLIQLAIWKYIVVHPLQHLIGEDDFKPCHKSIDFFKLRNPLRTTLHHVPGKSSWFRTKGKITLRFDIITYMYNVLGVVYNVLFFFFCNSIQSTGWKD